MAYAGVDADEITYTQEDMGGNLPQMPFLKDKQGTMHEDTVKILEFVAKTYKPDLMPKTEDEKINLDMVVNYLKALNTYLCQYCYGKSQDSALTDGIHEKLAPVIAFMKEQN